MTEKEKEAIVEDVLEHVYSEINNVLKGNYALSNQMEDELRDRVYSKLKD